MEVSEFEKKSILRDADTFYYPDFLTEEEADGYFEAFSNLDWAKRKHNNYELKRETTVYADSNLTDKAPAIWGEGAIVNEWTKEMADVKKRIEDYVGDAYNICLGNRYTKGGEFIAYHSDNEEYGTTKSIASLTIG